MAPPPGITVSQWADSCRRLSPESSAEPGQWSTSRAEYQRGIMDALNDPTIETVVIMSSAQVGKTEILNNVVGYYIDHDPSPILCVQPTVEMGHAWSKDRLAPMLRDSETLRGKVSDVKSRDSGNTLSHKTFQGGHITIAGANSPAGLASRPIRIVLCDEVDRYPVSAGSEGDPVSLAKRRTETFWNRKILITSTPTVKGVSRVEAEFKNSDKRFFYVPCPHCQASHKLVWKQVIWPAGEPWKALYHCEDCGAEWSEAQRQTAISQGEWIATGEPGRIAGFHLNAIYSSWTTPARMAEDFIESKVHPERLRVFVNTMLGETWEDPAETIDPHSLEARGEPLPVVPDWALVMTAGVDVQDDRLEITRGAWGVGEQVAVWHDIIYGDPSAPELWKQLDEYKSQKFSAADGRSFKISSVCIDTGGHHTRSVYAYCGPRFGARVYAIKGIGGAGKIFWPRRASKNNSGKINLFILGVDAGKDTIRARFGVITDGPGKVHFSDDLDGNYYRQLASERVETKYVQGFPTRVYVKNPSVRNEALDCFVYMYAALHALNIHWGRLAASRGTKAVTPRAEVPNASLPAPVDSESKEVIEQAGSENKFPPPSVPKRRQRKRINISPFMG